MSTKKRRQLNIELLDPELFDQLSQISDNLGVKKRAIIEDLLAGFIRKVKSQSPLLLIHSKSDPVDRFDALLSYQKIKEPYTSDVVSSAV